MKKICVVTGSRADYGLLCWLMREIKADRDFELQIIATGMHLSSEFGYTFQAIEEDGFKIARKVEMLTSSDTSVGISKSIGLGIIGFADVISQLSPDLIVVLGDRYEILSAATAAYVANVPIAHLHGGEVTAGALDDAFRHAITKMAHFHFVATDAYRNRVIQLGEDPDRVFLVGGLGIDGIRNLQLLEKAVLEDMLSIKFSNKNLLITFHPETLGGANPEAQMKELLKALESLKDTTLIFTFPNADAGGRGLIRVLTNFVEKSNNAYLFKSMGQLNYLSCMAIVDGVVGNSSSGLIEAPYFKKGTINIGGRQDGREQAASIINCEPLSYSIIDALGVLYSKDFSLKLDNLINPYGNGGASNKILKILKDHSKICNTRKYFYDLSEDNYGKFSK